MPSSSPLHGGSGVVMLTVSDFFRFFFFFFFLRDLLSEVSSPFSTFSSEVSLSVLDKFGPASLGPASSISLAAETALSALISWAETDFFFFLDRFFFFSLAVLHSSDLSSISSLSADIGLANYLERRS